MIKASLLSISFLLVFINCANGFDESINQCERQGEVVQTGSVEQLANAEARANELCKKAGQSREYQSTCEVACKRSGLKKKCDWKLSLIKVPIKPKFQFDTTEINSTFYLNGKQEKCRLYFQRDHYIPQGHLIYQCDKTFVLSDSDGKFAWQFSAEPLFVHKYNTDKIVYLDGTFAVLMYKGQEVKRIPLAIKQTKFDHVILSDDKGVGFYFPKEAEYIFMDQELDDVRQISIPVKETVNYSSKNDGNSYVANGFGDDVYIFTPPSSLFVMSSKGVIRHEYKIPMNCSSDNCINSKVPYVLPLSETLTHKVLFYSNHYAHNDGIILIDRVGNYSFKPLTGLTRNYIWTTTPSRPKGWGTDEMGNLTHIQFLEYEWHPTFGVMETIYFDKDMNPIQISKSPHLPNYRYPITLKNNHLLTCEGTNNEMPRLELYGKGGLLESLVLPIRFDCYGMIYYTSIHIQENGYTARSNEGKIVRLEIKRNGCQYAYLAK